MMKSAASCNGEKPDLLCTPLSEIESSSESQTPRAVTTDDKATAGQHAALASEMIEVCIDFTIHGVSKVYRGSVTCRASLCIHLGERILQIWGLSLKSI